MNMAVISDKNKIFQSVVLLLVCACVVVVVRGFQTFAQAGNIEIIACNQSIPVTLSKGEHEHV